jgi:chromate reductase, NAD(P)H dehydrogenase (quinone)
MADTFKILGISGSLRKGSYNTMALRAAQKLLPPGATMDTAEIGNLPLYNDDVRAAGYPPVVQAFRDKLAAADGLLIVTPEYNYSIPGVLKNAIDWGSRPPDQPFNNKPIAIMGASPGVIGTARAQYHMRQCFVFLNSWVVNKPEVMIGAANTRFNEAGELTDDNSKKLISDLLQALIVLARKVKAG